MKSALCISLILLTSCSTLLKPKTLAAYDPQVNCSPKSLIYLDQHLEKDQRSAAEKNKSQQRYKNFIKTKLDAAHACYLKELDQHKDIDYKYNVCMVVELNEESNISYLEIEDNNNPLPASVSKCLYDIFEVLDYKKVGGPGVFSQSLRFEFKKAQKRN